MPADCADVIGQVSCWYATDAADVVKLSRSSLRGKKEAKE